MIPYYQSFQKGHKIGLTGCDILGILREGSRLLMLMVAGDVMRYSSREMGDITEIVVRKSNEKNKSFTSLNANWWIMTILNYSDF